MSVLNSDKRYTLRGGPAVERRIGAMVTRVANLVKHNIAADDYRSLLLLGGYGRGEGGVIRQNGEELPHNNIDFLLVTTPRAALRRAALKRRLDELLAPVAREESLGIDTGVICDVELRFAPARVIWFDLRWGHQTVLGDAGFIPSLRPLTAQGIEIDDVHNLLVNRASLLVINDAIMQRGTPSGRDAEFVVKHLMKAIIGHGDALLFARGRYHASYAEKQKRMRELKQVLPGLAALYEEAAEFRFEPCYDRYLGSDFKTLAERTRETLALAHLAFERFRCGDDTCSFRDHPGRILFTEDNSPQSLVTGSKYLLRSFIRRPGPLGLPYPLEMAVRRAHPRKILAAVLPAILYGPTHEEEATLVQNILGAEGSSQCELRAAYLSHWAQVGDPNFPTTARQLGLSIETTRATS